MKTIIIILLTVLLSCQSAVPPTIEVEPVPVEKVEVEQIDQATVIWFLVFWFGSFVIISNLFRGMNING